MISSASSSFLHAQPRIFSHWIKKSLGVKPHILTDRPLLATLPLLMQEDENQQKPAEFSRQYARSSERFFSIARILASHPPQQVTWTSPASFSCPIPSIRQILIPLLLLPSCMRGLISLNQALVTTSYATYTPLHTRPTRSKIKPTRRPLNKSCHLLSFYVGFSFF